MSSDKDWYVEKKNDFSSMSARQQMIFLEKEGEKLLNQPNRQEKNVILDYHKYYLFKKMQKEKSLSKEEMERRKNLIAKSETQYTKIKNNIYKERKKNYMNKDVDIYICTCEPKCFTQTEADEIINNKYEGHTEEELFGCGKGCINKSISWECDENCKCGISCSNRKFQNHEYADVYPIETKDRGWGLCAGSYLPKNTFIIQYIGEIYSLHSDYGQKKVSEYSNKYCTYLMGLKSDNHPDEVVDPTKQGNMARFINHSCDPNCETRKYFVKGELCIGIFSKKNIQEGEELTFNYDFDLLTTPYQVCRCGAANCIGYLGISPEENKKKFSSSPLCNICGERCKHGETIIDCKLCGKFFHKKCAHKKGQLLSGNDYKCAHCLKKKAEKKENNEEKIRIDEEPTYDEIYEVGTEDLRKIKKNLITLNDIGAGLFWDFQSENAILGTTNKIDLRISGTTKQIEAVKEAINKLKMKKDETPDEYSIKLNVPKIYVRKIIGHQQRNLESYKTKFSVVITFDTLLMTDDIFSLQETTIIQIKGNESNVKAVALDIKRCLYRLRVLSVYLLPEDYFYLKSTICDLKTMVDPADLRLRKYEIKNDREIKHPFHYISNNVKDIVIIGSESEINSAQKTIKNHILRHNNLNFNYSLSFLFPIYFKKNLTSFTEKYIDYIKSNNLRIESVEPEYLRRHISVTVTGKWDYIIEIKKKLWTYLKGFAIEGTTKKHDINEFEQYAYNQEHKLISKNIRTYIIEQNPQIKNWDYISEDLQCLQEKQTNHLFYEGGGVVIPNPSEKSKNDGQDVIDNLINTIDKETRLNYLINTIPGTYRTLFKLNQNELFGDILNVLEESYENYRGGGKVFPEKSVHSESKLNLSVNDNKNDYNYENKEKEKLMREREFNSSSILPMIDPNNIIRKLVAGNPDMRYTSGKQIPQLLPIKETTETSMQIEYQEQKENNKVNNESIPNISNLSSSCMNNNPNLTENQKCLGIQQQQQTKSNKNILNNNINSDKKMNLNYNSNKNSNNNSISNNVNNTNNSLNPYFNYVPLNNLTMGGGGGTTKNFQGGSNIYEVGGFVKQSSSSKQLIVDQNKNREDTLQRKDIINKTSSLDYKSKLNTGGGNNMSSGNNNYSGVYGEHEHEHYSHKIDEERSGSASSYYSRKSNKGYQRSPSYHNRKDDSYYYRRKDQKSNYDYEGRRYSSKYYDRYEKDYDRYDKKKNLSNDKSKGYDNNHKKNSSYNDRISNYYYEEYNDSNNNNDYSMKYRDRDRERDRDRDIYRSSDRQRRSSESPKKNYKDYDDYNSKKRSSNNERERESYESRYGNGGDYSSSYAGRESKGGYSKDSYGDKNYYSNKDFCSGPSYKDEIKDNNNNYSSNRDYNKSYNNNQISNSSNNNRDYSKGKYSRNYGSNGGGGNSNNRHNRDYSMKDTSDNEGNMNINRFSNSSSNYNRPHGNKQNYENSSYYSRKRNFEENKYKSNYSIGNKYSTGRMMRSSKLNKSRSRSSSRRRSRSRSRSRSLMKHSRSGSEHKLNNNYD